MSLNLLPKAILIDAIIAIGGYGATLLNLSKFSKKEVELSVESTTLVIPETLLTSKVEIINIDPQQPSTGTPSMNISTYVSLKQHSLLVNEWQGNLQKQT